MRIQGPHGTQSTFDATAHVDQPCPSTPVRLTATHTAPRAPRGPSTGRRCLYHLQVYTSSHPTNAACMGDVHVTLAGALGEAGPFVLPGTPPPPRPPPPQPKPPTSGPLGTAAPPPPIPLPHTPPVPRFAVGGVDMYDLEGADVGPLEEVELWHDGPLGTRGWHCARVVVENASTGEMGVFKCGRYGLHVDGTHFSHTLYSQHTFHTTHRWIDPLPLPRPIIAGIATHIGPPITTRAAAAQHHPTPDATHTLHTAVETPIRDPTTTAGGYEVTLFTGRRAGAGTSSRVSLELLGTLGSSGVVHLRRVSSRSFAAGSVDVAPLGGVPWLGPLTHCRVGTDGSGLFAPWFLTCVGGYMVVVVNGGCCVGRMHVSVWIRALPLFSATRQSKKNDIAFPSTRFPQNTSRCIEVLHIPSSTTWLFACNAWIDETVNFSRLLRVRGPGEPDPRLLVRPCCFTRARKLQTGEDEQGKGHADGTTGQQQQAVDSTSQGRFGTLAVASMAPATPPVTGPVTQPVTQPITQPTPPVTQPATPAVMPAAVGQDAMLFGGLGGSVINTNVMQGAPTVTTTTTLQPMQQQPIIQQQPASNQQVTLMPTYTSVPGAQQLVMAMPTPQQPGMFAQNGGAQVLLYNPTPVQQQPPKGRLLSSLFGRSKQQAPVPIMPAFTTQQVVS